MNLAKMLSAALVASLFLAPGAAHALSGGIYDVARTGCTCHSGPVPSNLTTQVLIDGLPAGYGPGCTYPIRVFVLGVALPAPAFAGFNLQTTGGVLESPDGAARIRNLSECEAYERENGCRFDAPPGVPCGTKEQVGCSDDEVADSQATHDLEVQEGFFWDLEWTAPESVDDVTFHLSGNVVNGDGQEVGIADLWRAGSPTIVPADPAAACP